jgi:hypothetical protein
VRRALRLLVLQRRIAQPLVRLRESYRSRAGSATIACCERVKGYRHLERLPRSL